MIARLLLAVSLLSLASLGPVDLRPHCARPAPPGFAAAMAAQQPDPPEGNPGHAEPPPGWHCQTVGAPGVDADHACACHHKCVPNTDENGDNAPGEHVEENAKCRSFCYRDHCACEPESCS